jgi:hypothetical protein
MDKHSTAIAEQALATLETASAPLKAGLRRRPYISPCLPERSGFSIEEWQRCN